VSETNDSISMILFNGDLDHTMAALTLANGAAGAGMRVNIFFTFWGISLIRKQRGQSHFLLERIFKRMLPTGAASLGLSRFNFGGIGARMIRFLLSRNNAMTPESLLQMAMERKVNFIACEASLKILGIPQDELINYDHLSVDGVDAFIESARDSKIQLFI
jgi:peroxiredoxin family protein